MNLKKNSWFSAVLLLLGLTLLTGIVYPLMVTAIGQLFFSEKAAGSPVRVDGKVIGFRYLGQNFKDRRYFWPRPSTIEYQPLKMEDKREGPTSERLTEIVDKRRAFWQKTHGTKRTIPESLLYASASGLDPNISVEAAYFQLPRIVYARGWNQAEMQEMGRQIEAHVEYGAEIFPGEEGVNVLLLNLAADRLEAERKLKDAR